MPGRADQEQVDIAQSNPIRLLFGEGYALQTVLLWIIFFCSLLNLFLFAYWLPEVLHLTGLTPPEAARASSYRELGAVMAVLYLGVAIDRFGAERALAVHYAAGIVFVASIALLTMPYLILIGPDDRWQPDRCQRCLREALSSTDARQRPGLGARDRAVGRHCRAGSWRVPAIIGHASAADLPERLCLYAGGSGGNRTVAVLR